MNSSLISNDGTILFIYNGKSYTVTTTHPSYHKIVTAIKARKFKVAEKLASSTAIVNAIQKLSKRVVVHNGQVLFDGTPVGGVVVDRILKFIREGLPYKPLVRFLENIHENPSSRSVQELYKFLEHGNMPITDDGCFIGYKAIRNDWKDKYSGTIDNSIGKTPTLPRNQVDDNFQNGCSHGLHVGSYKYANDFASGDDRIVLVKVDPADAVSVPEDCQFQKLRAWRYKVIREVARTAPPLEGETFGEVTPNDPCEPMEDDEYECDHCGETHSDGDCED